MLTFLFTDIESSTRLWERDAVRMGDALRLHDRACREVVSALRGHVVKMTGDGVHAAFDAAPDALAAATELQRRIAAIGEAFELPLRIRCGLHAGTAHARDGDYFGSSVNRAARIAAAAHGGQVLLSQAVVDAAKPLPEHAGVKHLGRVRLRDLSAPEDVYQLLHRDLPSTFPALRSLDTTPNNLPQQLTSFIGREREIAAVVAQLKTNRLVTLSGSGGCGKTRLALQVAATMLDAFEDGVWLVELAALTDPSLIPKAVADVLGVAEARGKPLVETISAELASRRALIVVDNAEHLLAGCATLADVLLRSCPQLTLLVSSREALGITGETNYRVPSLSLPDATGHTEAIVGCESVRLFVERAQAQLPAFTLDDRTTVAVASICTRLDGIPLALELAAARIRVMSVAELDARLDERFRLLTGGSRTALPRQQTLRSTIDWSYALLDATEQALLRRLSVFAGGWSLDAAEQVCTGDDLDASALVDKLASLADKSLVSVEWRDAEPRYRLLETLRQYARERLVECDEAATWRERHATYFLRFVEGAKEKLRGEDQERWLQHFDAEHDNLRAVLAWSCTGGDLIAGLHLADSLFVFWYVRGHFTEAVTWANELLERAPDAPPSLRGDTFGTAGVMWFQLGDYRRARQMLEQALTFLRDDEAAAASTTMDLGSIDFEEGDFARARERFEEVLAYRRRAGSERGIAAALVNVGTVEHALGDSLSAVRHVDEALAIYRRVRDDWGMSMALCTLGAIALAQGEHVTAARDFAESVSIQDRIGDRRGMAESLEGLAGAAVAQDDVIRAGRLFGAAELLREALHVPMPPYDRARYDVRIAAARSKAPVAFAEAWREGRAMPLRQVVDDLLGARRDCA